MDSRDQSTKSGQAPVSPVKRSLVTCPMVVFFKVSAVSYAQLKGINPCQSRPSLLRLREGTFSGRCSRVRVAGAAVSGIQGALPRSLLAQTTLTPDTALRALMAGNERFDNNQLTSVKHDLRILKENTVEKQEPFGRPSLCRLARSHRTRF